MIKLTIFIVLSVSTPFSFGKSQMEMRGALEEQSFFSGRYNQTHVYGDGQSVDLGGQNTGNILSFDLESRTCLSFGPSVSESEIMANNFYSPVFNDYEFKEYSEIRYDDFVIGTGDDAIMNGVAWGPKESPSNSTCKIRAYYHDISFNGALVTLMYDFTGFLVGDSLLMTAAHGLYRDVTVGEFDDEIDNKYIPGKVEVYGAIGMADAWGSSYCYYSKGTAIFLPSSYVSYRNFADDWALMRLDKPLGRELSYRKLSTTPMDLSGDYRIIGYPSLNQFHLRMEVSSADYIVDSTRPMIEYSISSVDGMSGSPFYSADDVTFNIETGSDGRSYLASRAAYGMHVCSNSNHTIAYAITFSTQIIELVDSLNARYKPASDVLLFLELTGQDLGDASIELGGGYECNFCAQGCSISNNKLVLNENSSFSIEFPFPLSEISLVAESSNALPSLNAYSHSYDENYEYQSEIVPSNGRYTISGYGMCSIDITFNGPGYGENVYMISASITINWDFRVDNYFAPQYAPLSSFNGNCVSYAVEGIDHTNSGSILPRRNDGSTLNRLTDFYPGKVITGLKKALESENIELKRVGKYDICASDSYKIAIVCDPYRYYHVLRQNRMGAWSHYLIGEGVQCQDYDETFINWPDEARIVHAATNVSGSETHFDVSSFIGYFSIRSTAND